MAGQSEIEGLMAWRDQIVSSSTRKSPKVRAPSVRPPSKQRNLRRRPPVVTRPLPLRVDDDPTGSRVPVAFFPSTSTSDATTVNPAASASLVVNLSFFGTGFFLISPPSNTPAGTAQEGVEVVDRVDHFQLVPSPENDDWRVTPVRSATHPSSLVHVEVRAHLCHGCAPSVLLA